jgi:hypothetical protein
MNSFVNSDSAKLYLGVEDYQDASSFGSRSDAEVHAISGERFQPTQSANIKDYSFFH